MQVTAPTIEDQLPDEVLEAMAIYKQKLDAKLEAFAQSLANKRKDAVQGRAALDIEADWEADEEAYQGIDDANRDQTLKPSSTNGSFIGARAKQSSRSTVYLNITRPYVDAAAARVADMLLPNDETNWDIRPTPVPELIGMQPTAQAEAIAAQIEQIKEQARLKAAGSKRQIEDWLVQGQWHAEFRKVIEDSARIGTGILKGPVPVRHKSRVVQNTNGMMSLAIKEDISPVSKRIDPWNFFPDPACGEDIHSGNYCWERDEITAKQLRDLKGLPGYLDEQIDKVMEEGPQSAGSEAVKNPHGKTQITEDSKFEIWYFHGFADREDLEAAGVEIPTSGDVAVPAVVTMVNNRPIRAALNPLDSGEFPYDVMIWQRRAGVWAGIGVARQINTPQRMLNAGTRNMMDNAAFTAGPQMVFRKGVITPADGKWEITPRKVWFVADGADVNAVQQAIIAINIPTMQEQLSNIIQFALKMAEDVTGMPMLMQGSQGAAPDTVGGMVLVNNNSNVVLRRIIRQADDRLTEPHIRRYYEYLLMYGEDESIKGDCQIDARGSTSLIERDFQNNEAPQILQLSMNPAFGISPKQAMTEYLKSRRFDPKRFEPTEEERQQAAQQQPQPAPQVQVAQINAQTTLQKAQIDAQTKIAVAGQQAEVTMQRAQLDTDRDTVYVQAEQQKIQVTHETKMSELQMKYLLAQLEYANQQKITLDKVKADLAKEAAKLNLQRELAHLDATMPQVVEPALEPAGRAPDGQAFQK